jgi:aminopeptidase
MFDDFAPRLAQVLTEYSLPIQPGDYVAIRASVAAEPLIRALYEAVVKRGGNVFVMPSLPGLQETYFRYAGGDQLDFCDPVLLYAIEQWDVLFQILAPANTKALSRIDPQVMARKQKASHPINEAYFRRIDDESLRWNITAWPTSAGAQEAEMGLLDYTEFMYKACGLDHDDPVAYWQDRKARQQTYVDWLAGKKEVRITGPGIELTFRFDGRPWINDWGNNNFPSGEVFTSPLEKTVNGRVAFNFPTMYGGREINGVELTFDAGRVVEASAAKGEAYLLSQLGMDEGARYLGEFAIGTNYGIQAFTGSTLFDEKIGGTVHMALGKAIEEAGGTNDSQIHWDMVHDMKQGGEVYIDGDLFYRDGQFVIES